MSPDRKTPVVDGSRTAMCAYCEGSGQTHGRVLHCAPNMLPCTMCDGTGRAPHEETTAPMSIEERAWRNGWGSALNALRAAEDIGSRRMPGIGEEATHRVIRNLVIDLVEILERETETFVTAGTAIGLASEPAPGVSRVEPATSPVESDAHPVIRKRGGMTPSDPRPAPTEQPPRPSDSASSARPR